MQANRRYQLQGKDDDRTTSTAPCLSSRPHWQLCMVARGAGVGPADRRQHLVRRPHPHHERQGHARRGGGRGRRQDHCRGQAQRRHEAEGPRNAARGPQGPGPSSPASSTPTGTSSSAACRRCRPTCWPRPTARSRTSPRCSRRCATGSRRTPPPSRRPRSSSASATTTRSSRNCATRPRKNWTPSRRTSPSSSSTSPAHLATVNSAMLKAMGYDASSKDPAGGVIQRKPGTTEPNGTLEETALFAAHAGGARPRRPGRTEGLRARGRQALGALRLHHGRGRPGHAADRRPAEAGGRRRRLRERRERLSRRAGRPCLHQGQPEPHLHQPLPRRGRQAHHRRQPAGLHRLARPALLQAGRQLPAGLLRLCRGVGRRGDGRRPVGVRERHPDHHPRQRRARLRPADRRPPGGAGALPEGQGAAPRAHPRPVPARGPARQLQGAGRHPLALPDAHLLLGRLAPRPHRRPAGGHEHLAHRLGA